jgi:hypothetical protein
MLALTGWALAMWLRITLALALVVALVWWLAPTWLWLALTAAVLIEAWTIRQLAREWSWQARAYWWWAR